MKVNNVDRRNEYLGNGATTFPYDFAIADASHIKVIIDEITIVSGYSVTGVKSQTGGNVVFDIAPANGAKIIFLGDAPFDQTSSYQFNEATPATRIEDDFGKLVVLAQQLREILSRVPTITETYTPDLQPVAAPTAIDRFLRVASLDPLILDWATLAVLGGAIGIPVAVSNGGTGSSDVASARQMLQAQAAKATSIAAAATLPIGDESFFVVSGNTGITALPVVTTDKVVICRFLGTPLITHSASLVLQGAVDAQVAAGDIYVFATDDGGTTWRELWRKLVTNANSSNALLGNGKYGTIPLRGYIYGFRVTNGAGDPTNDLTIDADNNGICSSNDATQAGRVLIEPGIMTKQLDAVWAAGTGAGGRISTHALADGTWHVLAFKRSNLADDYCFSDTPTPVALPDGGTKYRRVFSFRRVAGAIQLFFHTVDGEVWLSAPILNIDITNPGTSENLSAINSMPEDIHLEAIFNVLAIAGTAVFSVYFSPRSTPDLAPSTSAAPLANLSAHPVTTGIDSSQLRIPFTPSDSVVLRFRATAAGAANIVRASLLGWHDPRV